MYWVTQPRTGDLHTRTKMDASYPCGDNFEGVQEWGEPNARRRMLISNNDCRLTFIKIKLSKLQAIANEAYIARVGVE